MGCGSSGGNPQPDSGGGDSGNKDSAVVDAGDSGTADSPGPEAGDTGCTGTGSATVAPTASNVKHVLVIVQENHSFDNYFGRYCTAPTGSNPTCTIGPACCEAAPTTDPGTGAAPLVQDDAANAAWDPDHSQAC